MIARRSVSFYWWLWFPNLNFLQRPAIDSTLVNEVNGKP